MSRRRRSMLIIPAIDLKDGKCVRLQRGDMDQATVYSSDPGAQAKAWQDCRTHNERGIECLTTTRAAMLRQCG